MDLDVLFEDNHVLAVSKPADLPTMGAMPGTASLFLLARDYIKTKYGKPGNVYLGVVSRLDAPATGVVVFARTSKAAARLSEQFRHGRVRKRYYVVVECPPSPDQMVCVDWVRKSESARRMFCVAAGTPGALEARLRFRVVERLRAGAALLEVDLVTGRKHQIRVQLSQRGWPILGDVRYGATTPWKQGIALHSHRLEIEHPVKRTPLTFVAPLPRAWKQWGLETPDRVPDW